MNPATVVFGTLAIVFAIAAALFSTETDNSLKVGQIYGRTNSGVSNDPGEENRPFVGMVEVKQINSKAVLYSVSYLSKDGSTQSFDQWDDKDYVRFDTRLK